MYGFFSRYSLIYADPVPGLKRVWRIRYTTQPVRMTGRVGGGGICLMDEGGVKPKESLFERDFMF
jgi:hypothetical protein